MNDTTLNNIRDNLRRAGIKYPGIKAVYYTLRELYQDAGYIILNSFVTHIPAWWIRRICYKIAGIKMGSNVRIGIGTKVMSPHRINLADGVVINEYCFLDGRGGLIISKNVSISHHCKIISASHNINDEQFSYWSNPIVIEDYVFIGSGAIVLDNSHLGRGCVIGAGAVIKGNLDENGIYIGNPAIKKGIRKCENRYELKHKAFFR